MPEDPIVHPTAEELRALSLGQLGEADLARVSTHLGDCPECCRRIDQLTVVDPLLDRLQKNTARPDDTLVGPAQRRSAVRALRHWQVTRAAAGSDDPAAKPVILPAPKQLGDYEILAEVGRGGMGVVYKAWHRTLHRLAALKMVLAGEFASPTQEVRFRLEAELAARVHHPNIVQVFEIGSYQDRPYLAMEWVDGGSLADRLSGQPWPAAEAASLLETLACAIHVAHTEGIVHRDLKPANILLQDGKGRRNADQETPSRSGLTTDSASCLLPKITDFGLARTVEGAKTLTQSGFLVGTPGYMAPEQVVGSDRRALVGPATDIFSLGVILYQLLTGQMPFQGDSTLEVLRALTSDEPMRPRRLQPSLPRDLEAITLHCLEKEPALRYQTAADLATDLRHWLAHEPIQARRVAAAERVSRWCKRNPAVAGLLAAVFLLLAAVAGVASVGYVQTKGALNREANQRIAAEEAKAKATREANRARTAEQEMRGQWYAAGTNLMRSAWDTGQVGRLRALLMETETYHDRRFEWYYWQRLCHPDQQTFIGHRAAVLSVSWSPNGTLLATGSEDLTATVWDAVSGQEMLTLKGHTSAVSSVSWSPDGTRLTTGSHDGTAKVWDAASGQEMRTLTGHTGPVYATSWSPDGTRLATGSGDGMIKVWEAADGRQRLTLRGHTGWVRSLSWSPNATRLATGSVDGTAKLWDATSGREMHTLKGHMGAVLSVSWSPDGTRLATGGHDGTAKVWDAARGRERLTLRGHAGWVRSVSWSLDANRLATGSHDGTVRVWDVASGREQFTLTGHTGGVYATTWSRGGTRLATGSADGTAKVWDVTGGREMHSLKGHKHTVLSVSWSPDGTRLVTGSQDNTAKVWDAAGSQEVRTLSGHSGAVLAVSWSPNGAWLVTGSEDFTAKIWDAASAQELRTLKGHTGTVYDVASSPDGTRLATGSHDGTAVLWNVASGRDILPLTGHTGTVYDVSWSPDGTRLATGSQDTTAKVWDTASGRMLLTLRGHMGAVLSVSWSPDGTRLATGSQDCTGKVWEAADGRELLALRGHAKRVRSVSWSPDGTRLATGSADGTAKVWDAAGGRELLTLRGHAGVVRSVAWSPDGTRVATGGDEGMMNVWEAAGTAAVQQWTRQDRGVQELLDSNDIRSPHAQGFLQTWLLLLPLPLAAGESGAQALDRQELFNEVALRPRPGDRVAIGARQWIWQEYRSPRAVVDINAVLGRVVERSIAYAICYLQSDRARQGLWLQLGSDDQAKVYLNGREIYQTRLPRSVATLDTVGPVGLKQGINVLLLKVVNETGQWEGCARLVDDTGGPVQGLHVKLTP
jgi:WD40 repeat protein/tRNA A-37 threonylcarbamoyl transferase component Bud32